MEQHLGKGRIMAKEIGHSDDWRVPGRRFVRTWDEPNSKGERIAAEFTLCENHRGKSSLMAIWKKNGYVDCAMETWWSVDVYCYDPDGHCYARYNPTVKPGGAGFVIDFDWMLEGTPENMEKLSAEIERSAFGAAEQSTSSTAA